MGETDWRVKLHPMLVERWDKYALGLNNIEFPGIGQVAFNLTSKTNVTCTRCGCFGHEGTLCWAEDDQRYYLVMNRPELLRGRYPPYIRPVRTQMATFLTYRPRRRNKDYPLRGVPRLVPSGYDSNVPVIRPLYHDPMRRDRRTPTPERQGSSRPDTRRPRESQPQMDQSRTSHVSRSTKWERHPRHLAAQPVYQQPVRQSNVRHRSPSEKHVRFGGFQQQGQSREVSRSKESRRPAQQYRDYQSSSRGRNADHSRSRSRNRPQATKVFQWRSKDRPDNEETNQQSSSRSRPQYRSQQGTGRQELEREQTRMDTQDTSTKRRRVEPQKLEGYADDMIYDGVVIPHEDHFIEREWSMKDKLDSDVGKSKWVACDYKGLQAPVSGMISIPKFDPPPKIRGTREVNKLYPTLFGSSKASTWRPNRDRNAITPIEDVIEKARKLDREDTTTDKTGLYDYVAQFGGDTRAILLKQFPRLDPQRFVIQTQPTTPMDTGGVDITSGEYKETFRRMKQIYLIKNRPEIVIRLLRKFPTAAVRNQLVDHFLRDPNLSQLRRSPSILLMQFYASERTKSVLRFAPKTWWNESEDLVDSSFVEGVKFGPGPVNPPPKMVQNLFPGTPDPDEMEFFDVTAKITQSNNMVLFSIPTSEWRYISHKRQQQNAHVPFISNMGWIAFPDGSNGDPATLKRKGFLNQWIPNTATEAYKWGGEERATIDFTKPINTQFHKTDEVILRICIQQQPYNIWQTSEMPGKSDLITPHLHTRMYATFGQFTKRAYVEESPGIIIGYQKNVEGVAPDGRFQSDDGPTDINYWKVMVPGASGLKETARMSSVVMWPCEHQYNTDLVGIGAMVYVRYLPQWYKVIDTGPKKGKYGQESTEHGQMTVKVDPVIVDCILGPEAWLKIQMWMATSEESIQYIPKGWRDVRPGYEDLDFLIMMYGRIHCLLSINENRAEELALEGVALRLPAKMSTYFPEAKFDVYVPNPRFVPVEEGKREDEENQLRTKLAMFHFHIHMPLSIQLLYQEDVGPQQGEYRKNKQVGDFNGIVNEITPCYATRDDVICADSPIWPNQGLDSVSPEEVITTPTAADVDLVSVGRIITITAPARSSIEMTAYLQGNKEIQIELKPRFNQKTREAISKETCENRIMKMMDREREDMRSVPKLAGKRYTLKGVASVEESVKNLSIAAFLGLPIGPRVMAKELLDTQTTYQFFYQQKWKELTPNQSKWIAAALQKKDVYDLERPLMMLIGPPGSGKSTTIFSLAREVVDEGINDKGMDSSTRVHIEEDGETRQIREVVGLIAPTHAATFALCEKAGELLRLGAAKLHEQYPNRRATVWAEGMPYRPILIRPIAYMGTELPTKEAEEMSLNYYMFKDQTAPPEVITARETHERAWQEYQELAIDTMRMRPGKAKTERQKVVRYQLEQARELQDALYVEVLRQGKFNMVIMTFRQGVSYMRQQKDELRITQLIMDEAAYSPDSATFVATRLLANNIARQLVIAGDPFQLRPVVHSKGVAGRLHAIDSMSRITSPGDMVKTCLKLRSKQSALDKLQAQTSTAVGGVFSHVLTDNFRHTDCTGHYTSWTRYNNQVHSGLTESQQMNKDFDLWRLPWPIEGFPCAWLGVRGPEAVAPGVSVVNETHIEQAASLAWLTVEVFKALPAEEMMFLTPYAATATYLDDELAKLWPGQTKRPHCKTIDAVQGREFRLVVLVLVRCRSMRHIEEFKEDYGVSRSANIGINDHEWYYPTYDHDKIDNYTITWFNGFMNEFTRWNVATSRDMSGKIIIGDPMTNDFCLPAFILHRWLLENRSYLECGVQTWTRMSLFSRATWYNQEHQTYSIPEMVQMLPADQREKAIGALPEYAEGEVSMKLWPRGNNRDVDMEPMKRVIKVGREVKHLDTIFPDRKTAAYRMSHFTVHDPQATVAYRKTYMVPQGSVEPDDVDTETVENLEPMQTAQEMEDENDQEDEMNEVWTVVDLYTAGDGAKGLLQPKLEVIEDPTSVIRDKYVLGQYATMVWEGHPAPEGVPSFESSIVGVCDPLMDDLAPPPILYELMIPEVAEVETLEEAQDEQLNALQLDWSILKPAELCILPFTSELDMLIEDNPILLEHVGAKWLKRVFEAPPQTVLIQNWLLQREMMEAYKMLSGGTQRAVALMHMELWRWKALDYRVKRKFPGQKALEMAIMEAKKVLGL